MNSRPDNIILKINYLNNVKNQGLCHLQLLHLTDHSVGNGTKVLFWGSFSC